MKIADCPNCGSSALFTTVAPTAANGAAGPRLLPDVPMGRLNVVICGDCGLTRLFARHIDVQALKASGAWTSISTASTPLGLNDE